MKIINLILRRILGLILMPFLYARYNFILFLPLLYIDGYTSEMFFVCSFIYTLTFAIFMGNMGLMKYWTKLFVKILNVKYEILGYWTSDTIFSYNDWTFPILKVRDKEYKLMISIGGGNLYEKDDNLRRKSIVYWLLK